MRVGRAVPSYVARGSCSDCLRVWDREYNNLLARIRELERENASLKKKLATADGENKLKRANGLTAPSDQEDEGS